MRNRRSDRWKLVGLAATLFAVCMTFGMAEGGADARNAPESALATAPAEPLSVFNPNHIYLDNGTNGVSGGSGTISVTASTFAQSTVDTIGITFFLQKWNGSAWETVSSGTMRSSTQKASFTDIFNYSVTAGYYYRARTLHWVIENGTYEEGERLSNTVLAS